MWIPQLISCQIHMILGRACGDIGTKQAERTHAGPPEMLVTVLVGPLPFGMTGL
jgi:hypothetical protein